MEQNSVKLAKKISTVLKNQDYDDCVAALQIAKIMLPKKAKKSQGDDAESDPEGDLVPADKQLMEFSKVMNRATTRTETVEPNPTDDSL